MERRMNAEEGAHALVQGLIRAPTPAKRQAEGGETSFWDRPGAQGVAKELQSTELAIPGGRKADSPTATTPGTSASP